MYFEPHFRCCITFDRVKWCYSEVVYQFYKSENVIKISGTFRNPEKVKMWPTVFTDVIKGISVYIHHSSLSVYS